MPFMRGAPLRYDSATTSSLPSPFPTLFHPSSLPTCKRAFSEDDDGVNSLRRGTVIECVLASLAVDSRNVYGAEVEIRGGGKTSDGRVALASVLLEGVKIVKLVMKFPDNTSFWCWNLVDGEETHRVLNFLQRAGG